MSAQDPVPSRSDTEESTVPTVDLNGYKDTGFAAYGEEPPFWVSVEAQDGKQRSKADALAMVDSFWGEAEEEGWAVTRVPMYVGTDEYGDLRVHREPIEGGIGPFDFWKVDEA